ncbi:hypothetical protein Efla_007508 [Eimeria flavescens]
MADSWSSLFEASELFASSSSACSNIVSPLPLLCRGFTTQRKPLRLLRGDPPRGLSGQLAVRSASPPPPPTAAAGKAAGAAGGGTGGAAAAASGGEGGAAAAPGEGGAAAAGGGGKDAHDAAGFLWQLSDLPAADAALLRAAVRSADRHKVESPVCLIRCSGWNTAETQWEQERLLLQVKRGPLQSALNRPVPSSSCLSPHYLGGPPGCRQQKRNKEDLLRFNWEMMFLVSGLSATHLDSVAETVVEDLIRLYGRSIYKGRDGRGSSGWVALNFGKLHVHLMTPITRKRYTLELLHKECPRVDLRDLLSPHDSPEGFEHA